MENTHAVPGTAAFQKFMRVLQAVSDTPGQLNISGLARQLAMPRPTVHRIVEALVVEGMLRHDNDTLSLGPRLVSLAWRSLETHDLRQIARPHIEQLRDRLDETVHLAIPDGLEMVYIDKLEANRTVRMASRIGTRVSLFSSSVGKAWLAAHSADQVEQMLAKITPTSFTQHTITDRAGITDEINRTRERGYSQDIQENELDICCYGSAIINSGQQAVGCISVSMPTYRFDALQADEAIGAIRACVAAIQKQLV